MSMECNVMLPLKQSSSPSNYSPFLTGMAKEARMSQILIWEESALIWPST